MGGRPDWELEIGVRGRQVSSPDWELERGGRGSQVSRGGRGRQESSPDWELERWEQREAGVKPRLGA